MTDLVGKIDCLAQIDSEIETLKKKKSQIEAEITKQCTTDLQNTKYKSIRYHGTKSDLTAVNAESLKIIYATFLPMIFGEAYKDVVSECKTYKLSAPAARMIIGLWKGNYINVSVADVINQMDGVTDNEKQQLIKKCKGINYDKDIENIMKFTDVHLEDAREYAYMISEAAVWQNFCNLLGANGIKDEQDINDILQKIQSAFVVEDSTKITLTR